VVNEGLKLGTIQSSLPRVEDGAIQFMKKCTDASSNEFFDKTMVKTRISFAFYILFEFL